LAVIRVHRPSVVVVNNASGRTADAGALSTATPAAASAESGSEPDTGFVVVALIAVAAVWIIGFWWNPFGLKLAGPAALATGVSVFALLYIVAQALERLLEPLSALDPKKKDAEENRDTAVAAALADPTTALLTTAADTQATLERLRRNRAMIFWAAATVLGMFISATTGIYLLDIVIDNPTPPQSLDVLITGLVVGGGTKPLHDLISRIESAKEEAQDPPETS
jgi:branched-subunit amino acid ABC-type transport system permease component